jgi:hypothetical protein
MAQGLKWNQSMPSQSIPVVAPARVISLQEVFMSSAVNPRRPARGSYRPRPETLAKLRVSGNPINGLGESSVRRPSPFFWHPPDKHPWGELQIVARESSRVCPGSQEAFQRAYEYLTLLSVAGERKIRLAAEWTDAVRKFALEHEADATGIAAMDPLWVFEGYSIEEPWIIILALAHNYERLKEVPSDETNGVGVCDIGREQMLDFPDDGGIARPRPRGAFLRSGGRTRRHANPKSIWGSCSGATVCRRSVCSLRNDVCRRTASGSPASDGILLDSPKWVKPDRLLYKILYKNRPGF